MADRLDYQYENYKRGLSSRKDGSGERHGPHLQPVYFFSFVQEWKACEVKEGASTSRVGTKITYMSQVGFHESDPLLSTGPPHPIYKKQRRAKRHCHCHCGHIYCATSSVVSYNIGHNPPLTRRNHYILVEAESNIVNTNSHREQSRKE
eukprot:scaffold15554_cov155-Skeletonema_dohrnii-CCMP3373.AAC.4